MERLALGCPGVLRSRHAERAYDEGPSPEHSREKRSQQAVLVVLNESMFRSLSLLISSAGPVPAGKAQASAAGRDARATVLLKD